MSACAQTRGRIPALRDRVIIGVADTAAHLYRDAEDGPHDPARRIIREQRGLDQLWSTLQHPLPAPRVDFSQSDVLVAAFGIHGSLGPTISIDTVLTRGAERIVVVRVTDVNEQCLVASELTFPVDIVVVPHESTRTTQFVERRARLPGCFPSPRPIRRYNRQDKQPAT
jgi:hypothetical protein